MKKFERLDHQFSSKERKFIGDLINSINEMNTDKFSSICQDYDSITSLNKFHVDLLSEIKRLYFYIDDIDLNL